MAVLFKHSQVVAPADRLLQVFVFNINKLSMTAGEIRHEFRISSLHQHTGRAPRMPSFMTRRREDCAFAQSLGYDTAWFIEHHFSDYFPTPSPFVFMASIAARCPELNLGTCATVTPWYHPLRFAEEVAMLSHITKAELFIGMGRGSAPMEYEAYGVDQNLSREIFAEHWEIIRKAFSGERFAVERSVHQDGPRGVLRPVPGA